MAMTFDTHEKKYEPAIKKNKGMIENNNH